MKNHLDPSGQQLNADIRFYPIDRGTLPPNPTYYARSPASSPNSSSPFEKICGVAWDFYRSLNNPPVQQSLLNEFETFKPQGK